MSSEFSDSTSTALHLIKQYKVRMSVGRMAYEAGLFTQAARHFRAALQICEDHNLDDELISRALLGVAKSIAAVGQYDDAEKLIRRALLIDESDSGSLVEEAEDYHQLSLLYWRSGHSQLAKEFAMKSWNYVQQDETTPDELKAKLLKHLAVLAEQSGELRECERYLDQALELIEISSQLNKQCSIYGDILLVKVLLLADQNRLKEARELYEQAVDIVEMNRGVSHPRVHEMLSIFQPLASKDDSPSAVAQIKDVLNSAQARSKHGIV